MKRGIVVSDTHAGSIYGLLPPGFVTFEGVEKKLNVGQQYLWECWEDFCERVAKFKPDFVICNGDLIDGPQKKNHGSDVWRESWLGEFMETLGNCPLPWCGAPKVVCPNCGKDVHLDEIVGVGCVICKRKSPDRLPQSASKAAD